MKEFKKAYKALCLKHAVCVGTNICDFIVMTSLEEVANNCNMTPSQYLDVCFDNKEESQ